TGWAGGASVRGARQRSGARAAEHRELLPGPLRDRVEPQKRLEVGQRGLVARGPRSQVVRLEDVPVAGVRRLAEERRALELVADELGPLRCDHEEADEVLVRRDIRVA